MPATARDYYEVLGVSKTVTDKEIRAAYRKLARKYHPDLNPGDKAAEAKFKEIQGAYDVLADAEKRKKYDIYGHAWEHAGQQQPGPGPRPSYRSTYTRTAPGGGPTIDYDMGGEDFDLGDILGKVFGGLPAGPRRRRGHAAVATSSSRSS